jgi:DNA polymerase III alpha subunit (gram-positive type)
MYSYLHSDEFRKLEEEYPLLRRAREQFLGLRGIKAVIVDIETTGLEPAASEITEVAALKIEKGEIVDVYSSLIRIQGEIPPEIIRLTGITQGMLEESGAEKISVLNNLLQFIGELPLIAHNTEFDIPFINHHLYKGLGKSLQNPLICTLKLSQKLLPGLSSHKLRKVAEHFNIPTPLTHRAPGDVEITHQLWLKLIDLLERNGVHSLEDLLKFGI